MTEFKKKKIRRKINSFIVRFGAYTFALLMLNGILFRVVFGWFYEDGKQAMLIADISITVSLGVAIIFIILPILFRWDIDIEKPPGEYKDNLIYDSFKDFLEAANKYFISNGFSEYKSEELKELQDVWVYQNISGLNNWSFRREYNMIVVIVEMEKLSKEYFDKAQKAMTMAYEVVKHEIYDNDVPTHCLCIFNTLNIDEEFHDYFSRDMYMSVMSGKVNVRLMAGLSFDEKSLYIQKTNDLKGRKGYKILLSTFCDLMQIETPDFWTKKKKVKRNKGERN